MSELRKARVNKAKEKLAEALPDAVQTIADLSKNAKNEGVKLNAAKEIIAISDSIDREEDEVAQRDFERELDSQIKYLLKELQRAKIFTEMRAALGPDATPQEIIQLREQLDVVFGVTDLAIEGEVVNDD